MKNRNLQFRVFMSIGMITIILIGLCMGIGAMELIQRNPFPWDHQGMRQTWITGGAIFCGGLTFVVIGLLGILDAFFDRRGY